MMILKKRRWIQVCACGMAAVCVLSACSKTTKPGGNTNTGTRPATAGVVKEQQTVSDMKVFIKDITSNAGEDIDYIGAIDSAENLELNRSMIYVDSSAVDSNTPGTYKAIYTLDYLGSMVSNSVKVTILENPEKETTATDTETTTESLTAIVKQELPAAELTLSSGRVVSIRMTSARYITETYTVENYYEEDGMTFLNSELRIVFNTGEEQVVETVVTRVQPQNTTVETSEKS